MAANNASVLTKWVSYLSKFDRPCDMLVHVLLHEASGAANSMHMLQSLYSAGISDAACTIVRN